MPTCLDLFYRQHPNGHDPINQGMCPDQFDYLEEPKNCNALHGHSEFSVLMSCDECWKREVTVASTPELRQILKNEKENVNE